MARTDLSHWNTLWRDLHAQGNAAQWHQRLVGAYAENTRYYHNLQHLAECLGELDSLRADARQPALVEMAIWFHDIVYDSHSASNEADSARLAGDCLVGAGMPDSAVETVRQLILCTKTHEPGMVDDAALLIDIDLAILGQPSGRFWEYEHAIRSEYAWVPAPVFAQKRAEILLRFLQRPAIYRTAPFMLKYETAARTNLQAAIERLQTSLS